MARLDLDAYHAEHDGEGHEVTIAGKTYSLPAKVPMLFPEYLSSGRMLEALACLFGEHAEEAGRHLGIDTDGGDLAPILGLYGLDLPESSASSEPSPNTGDRSRQTSGATTNSPSETPAGASR